MCTSETVVRCYESKVQICDLATGTQKVVFVHILWQICITPRSRGPITRIMFLCENWDASSDFPERNFTQLITVDIQMLVGIDVTRVHAHGIRFLTNAPVKWARRRDVNRRGN